MRKRGLSCPDADAKEPGGHDLFPVPGTRKLFITSLGVWTFDTESETFEAVEALGKTGNVKSISQCTPGGPTIVMEATESWWSDTIRVRRRRPRQDAGQGQILQSEMEDPERLQLRPGRMNTHENKTPSKKYKKSGRHALGKAHAQNLRETPQTKNLPHRQCSA